MKNILALALVGPCALCWLFSCVAEESFESNTFAAVEPDTAENEAAQDGSGDADQATKKEQTVFNVKFETSKGDFVMEVHPDWAPLGAARFKELVEAGFYNDVRFFRVLDGFMAQFGINGDPAVSAKWRESKIKDDPVTQSNTRGMVSYAMAGPGTRTSQLFINYGNNKNLDGMGFSPFAKVVDGMEVVDSLYSQYGEGAPRGRGPDQGRIQSEGNAYLNESFPKLDYIKQATIVKE